MALQQRQPQFTPNRFFNPDEDFAPANSNAQPAGTAPAPQPGDIAAASSAQPAPALTAGADPMSSPDAFHAPSQADYVKANTPARPVGELDNVHGARRGFALALAGLGKFGSNLTGQQNNQLERWTDQELSQRQFDANQGKNAAAAKIAGAGEQLGQTGQQLGNEELGARIGLTKAQTTLALQNLPAQEAAEKLHGIIQDAWLNKKIPPQQFDQWAQEQISAAPANVGRMVSPHLAEIKKMQPTGKGYALTMQDDLPKSVNVYGKEYDRNDPELEKVAPGAGADYDRALAAHTTKRGEKLTDEKTVAGFAADRQAAGFTQAEKMRENQQNFETDNKRKADVLKEDLALSDSKQRFDQLNNAVTLAQKGNVIEAQNAVLKTLGLSLDGITKRINQTELAKFEGAGSAGQRLAGSLRGWSEGDPFPDSVWRDVQEFAKESHETAVQKHDRNIQLINTQYGHGGGAASTPQTHKFSSSAWQKANPGKDVNAAIAAAKEQGYEVLP